MGQKPKSNIKTGYSKAKGLNSLSAEKAILYELEKRGMILSDLIIRLELAGLPIDEYQVNNMLRGRVKISQHLKQYIAKLLKLPEQDLFPSEQ
jgi:hypothetical protein